MSLLGFRLASNVNQAKNLTLGSIYPVSVESPTLLERGFGDQLATVVDNLAQKKSPVKLATRLVQRGGD